MLLLNALRMLVDWGLSSSDIPQFSPILRRLTNFNQLHILPLFGIYKQVPLDCMPLAICMSHRKPSGSRFARWKSCVWECKELYHATDFLVNCYIYFYEIIQKFEVIALSLRKEKLTKRNSKQKFKKNGRCVNSICRGCWWTWDICNISYSRTAHAVLLQYGLDHF